MLLTVDFMFVQRAWASWSVCSKVGWFWGLDVWSVRASQRGERTSRTSVSLCLMTSPAAPMTSLRVRIFTTISCKIVVMEVFVFLLFFFCGCGFYFPPFYLKNLVFLGGFFQSHQTLNQSWRLWNGPYLSSLRWSAFLGRINTSVRPAITTQRPRGVCCLTRLLKSSLFT